MRRVLVLDVGGTHVKALVTGAREPRKFASGPAMTPRRMVEAVKHLVDGWHYDVVALGYPGLVVHGRIAAEPRNLGRGWVGFDFERAFGCPVRVVNDAAMQALGSAHDGRTLFLGLGTGLGSAMVVDGRVEPMELAHLPWRKGRTYEEDVGAAGLARLGKKRWRKHVWRVVDALRAALEPDEVVVGGGNARLLKHPPAGVVLGDNANAFTGGFRLWRDEASRRASAKTSARREGDGSRGRRAGGRSVRGRRADDDDGRRRADDGARTTTARRRAHGAARVTRTRGDEAVRGHASGKDGRR